MSAVLYLRRNVEPQRLPFEAHDPSGRLWTDLANSEEGRAATGWDREAPPRPDDTETQTAEWDASAEAWVMVDWPPPPPLPTPEPAILGKGEFLDLFLAAGVPLAKIREASDDPRLVDFWFALDRFYSQVHRDHPSTRDGVAAMVALGHIEAAAAEEVFASWPSR